MKKYKALILCLIIVCFSITGCRSLKEQDDVDIIIMPTSADESKTGENDEAFSFTLWNNAILDTQYIELAIKEKYPNATLKIEPYDAPDSEKVIKAIASNEPIDLVTYYRDGFGNFNAINGFEDLLQPMYDFKNIKSIFNERELEHCKSFDDSKLLALPSPEYPTVTYYRADILGKYGFPTDPVELGEYMSTLEGWMKIAKTLHKDDIHVLQWNEELYQRALRSYAFYDDNMNLIVNNEKVRESLKLTIEVNKLGLASRVNVWALDGEKLIKENKIAMMYINKWGEGRLNEIAPEQEGKWRATRLPLNIYGYQSSCYASIPSTSKHKKESWEILKFYMVNDYKNISSQIERKSKYFGGQKSMQLYEDLINNIPLRYPTMLDDRNFSIFIDILYNNMDTKSAEDILNLSISKINEETYKDQKVLSEYLKENRKQIK